ncbi:Esterase EstP [Burkholderiales bacterium]|nr:Esterase EstP [Burkholderiales bacterium]
MRMPRLSRISAALALAFTAGAASAQFSNFYSFGDSLSDAGSFKPFLPPGTGLFTTNPGPMWTQVLAERYGLVSSPANQGGNDYAEGGARVSQNPGVPASFPLTADATPVLAQIAQHLAAGPTDSGALFSVWAGANDLFTQFSLLQAGTITSAELQANMVLAATQLVGGIALLQAAGAHNLLVFNLPDAGKTPDGIASGQGAAIGQVVNLYNSALQAGLNQIGGNVIRVNIRGLFDEVIADPSRYGFANVTSTACNNDFGGRVYALFCTPDTLVSPDAPSTYLFADGNHPTTAGMRLVAQLAASMIEGPQMMAALGEAPLAVEAANFRAVDGRMQSSLNTPRTMHRFQPWVAFDYANPDLEGSFISGDADVTTVAVGGDMKLSDRLLVGGAFGYTENKGDFGGGGYKLRETTGTFYAGYGEGPWYVGARLGAGGLDYRDVHRSFEVGIATRIERGETSGYHYFGSLVGGYWLAAGRLLHGPFAKVTYQHARVRQFAEQGSSSTALAYGQQKREALQTSLGWQVSGEIGGFRPFGRVTWEYDAMADDRSIDATPVQLGGTYSVGAYRPDDNFILFGLGASRDFGRITGFVNGAATASKGDGDYYAVTLGVRIPLE